MSNPTVETLIKHACSTTGEGPAWDSKSGKLLYVDIQANNVHRLDVVTKQVETVTLAGNASLIVPATKGGYIVSSQRKLCHLNWETKNVTDLVEVANIGSNDRFNDGKCDPKGRLWAGTMGNETVPAQPELNKGKLYKLDSGAVSTMVEPVGISNGLAWTADHSVMFYIDSTPRSVYAYDYDITDGTIANKRIVVDFNQWDIEEAGFPDGMTIDQDGKLWICGYLSSKVMQFDPVTGKKLRHVDIPGKRTTSCCWGGPDLTDLYVTTGRTGWTQEQMQQYDPLAGSLFKVTGLGVKGTATHEYAG